MFRLYLHKTNHLVECLVIFIQFLFNLLTNNKIRVAIFIFTNTKPLYDTIPSAKCNAAGWFFNLRTEKTARPFRI